MNKLLIPLLAIAASAPVLLAQDLPTNDLDLSSVVTNAHGISKAGDDLVGYAGSLRAAFADDFVEFVPQLGRGAERNEHLRLAPTSIRRGSEVTSITARALGFHDSHRVNYDLGNGIRERYVSRSTGFKQSFFFDEQPAGVGDLAVRLAVASSMNCAGTENAQELFFDAGDLGGVRIRSVVGIDAMGKRVDGHMRFDGTTLELVLPGDFVDSASYPLELDPVMSGAIDVGCSDNDAHPDIAYDAVHQQFMVVFERVMSATDTDVCAQRVALNGAVLGGSIVIAQSIFDDARLPKVAHDPDRQNWFVVWQDKNLFATTSVIKGRILTWSGIAGPIVTISSSIGNCTSPDVGSDLGRNFICVWADSFLGVMARNVGSPTGGGTPTLLGLESIASGAGFSSPSITKSDGWWNRFFVAYVSGSTTVYVAALDDSGVPLGSPVIAGSTFSAGEPDIAGNGQNWALVYSAPKVSSGSDRAIFKTMGTFAFGSPQITQASSQLSVSSGNEHQPCIGWTQEKYVAAWKDDDFDVIRVALIRNDGESCRQELYGSSALYTPDSPAIATCLDGGASSTGYMSRAMLCYRRTNPVLLNATSISAFLFEVGGGSVTPVAGSTGCGLGGTCYTNGPFTLGNENFEVNLYGADPSSPIGLLILDLGDDPLHTACGVSCRAINLDIVITKSVNSGAASWSYSPSCTPANLGFEMHVQYAVFSLAPGGCALVPEFHVSNALHLKLVD